MKIKFTRNLYFRNYFRNFPVTVYSIVLSIFSPYIPVFLGSSQRLWLASLRGCRVWNERWTHLRCHVQTCLFLLALVGHTLEKPKINRGRYSYHGEEDEHEENLKEDADQPVSKTRLAFTVYSGNTWFATLKQYSFIIMTRELLSAVLSTWKSAHQQSKAGWTLRWARAACKSIHL